MPIHEAEIRKQVENYKLGRELIPGKNVLISADRNDLHDGVGLERVFLELEPKLKKFGFNETAIWSVKDIILEFASNTILHGKGQGPSQELLVVSRHERQLRIWLFGYASRHQLKRLQDIIGRINALAEPPDHKEKLFERRNHTLIRTRLQPSNSKTGAGVGMLTVAALSSQALKLTLGPPGEPSAFVLQSSVQSSQS